MPAAARPTIATLSEIARESLGRPLQVLVLRRRRGGGPAEEELVALTLTPHAWAGKGTLGCRVVQEATL